MDQEKQVELIGAMALAQEVFALMDGKGVGVCIEVLLQIICALSAFEGISPEIVATLVGDEVKSSAKMIKKIKKEEGDCPKAIMARIEETILESIAKFDPETWCASCKSKRS